MASARLRLTALALLSFLPGGTARPADPPRPAAAPAQADVYPYAGLPPEKAARVMTAPEGFAVKLFAGEPDVHQPIALCLDDRGRLWVAEAYSYPVRRPEKEARDRIVIFEDTDGDGRFGKRTVFMEGLNLVSGLEVGFGGVWIGAAPQVLFVPMKDGADRPAGPAQVLLDGWGYQDTHETLNTFTWGPDGWLYGCQGVFTHSRVGRPGTPDFGRVPINAGVWRYHPTRHVFEVFAHGTSNPWGLDFNDYGDAFIEACVIPHCFHVVWNGRYQRQAGEHFNPYTFDDIPTIADHLHYQGANPWVGNDRSGSAGGGHAHCGTLIYLGGAWPARYRGQMLMGNIHGHRLNQDLLTPRGSGYVARHGPDFLLAHDAWARFINLRTGPDGNVYLIDWYDKQACHTHDVQAWDRSNGRIYKICYQGTRPARVDLRRLADRALVDLQLHANDWYVRHARRLLQERGGSPAVHDALARIAFGHPDETRRLRGLWALHVTGGLNAQRVLRGLADTGPHVRAWTVRLALENGQPTDALWRRLAELARADPSPMVRLALASGLQALPPGRRWEVLDGLLAHGEDASDPNLPLMDWYAAEPLGGQDPARALDLAQRSKIPLLTFMVRRIGMSGTPQAVALVVERLAHADDPASQRACLDGLNAALAGRGHVAMPAGWPGVFARLRQSTDAGVRRESAFLAVTFGDPAAMAQMRGLLASSTGDPMVRQSALAALVAARDPQLAPLLQGLLADRSLRAAALRGLAAYDDVRTPAAVLGVFAGLDSEEKRDALNTLACRAAYGQALLDALAARKLPPADVPAEVIRQLRNLHDAALDRRIAEVWGQVRATPADRALLITRLYRRLSAPAISHPDPSLGRAVFVKVCAQCHTLFGSGGHVGPDLTGGNRGSLEYLLENVLDPSAIIPKEYVATRIELKDGRIIIGIVRAETPAALTVVTANETVTVPRGQVEERTPSPASMMPDDLLSPLRDDEVRALFAYLQSPAQVPILATPENARDFFNGKDLTGWDGDARLWRIEHGELVGRSPGLRADAFLRSHFLASDFRLRMKVKLSPESATAAIFFGAKPLLNGDLKGPCIDLGADRWGQLSEQPGGARAASSREPSARPSDWNDCEILVQGRHVRTFLNGHPCADAELPAAAPRGIIALTLPTGAALEVRIKDLRLEVLKE